MNVPIFEPTLLQFMQFELYIEMIVSTIDLSMFPFIKIKIPDEYDLEIMKSSFDFKATKKIRFLIFDYLIYICFFQWPKNSQNIRRNI